MSRTPEEIQIRRQAKNRAVRRRRGTALAGVVLAIVALGISLRVVVGPSASDAMKRAAEAIGASGDADAAAAPAGIGPGLPPDELVEKTDLVRRGRRHGVQRQRQPAC